MLSILVYIEEEAVYLAGCDIGDSQTDAIWSSSSSAKQIKIEARASAKDDLPNPSGHLKILKFSTKLENEFHLKICLIWVSQIQFPITIYPVVFQQ